MGRYAFDTEKRKYVDYQEMIQDYGRFCMEFCLEWTKWSEESLLKKHEIEFFKIFLTAKERQAAQQKLIEKNNNG